MMPIMPSPEHQRQMRVMQEHSRPITERVAEWVKGIYEHHDNPLYVMDASREINEAVGRLVAELDLLRNEAPR